MYNFFLILLGTVYGIHICTVDSRLNSVSIKFGTQLNSVSSAGFILANFDKKIANFDQTQPTANRRSNFRPLKRHWDSEKKAHKHKLSTACR